MLRRLIDCIINNCGVGVLDVPLTADFLVIKFVESVNVVALCC